MINTAKNKDYKRLKKYTKEEWEGEVGSIRNREIFTFFGPYPVSSTHNTQAYRIRRMPEFHHLPDKSSYCSQYIVTFDHLNLFVTIFFF